MNFLPINGFEGIYFINKDGQILSKRCNKEYIRKSSISRNGYRFITLMKDGKYYRRYIHRLLAHAFIPNINQYNEINHKDGNKLNNELSNLEWCTRSHNCKHTYIYGLKNNYLKKVRAFNESQISEIKELYSRGNISQLSIANIFNVSQGTIGKIVRNERYLIKT